MSEEKTTEQQAASTSGTNLIACLAFCPALFFVPFLTGDAKNNEVAKNSMNQGLLSLIILICVNILSAVIALFPYAIMKIGNLVVMIFSLCMTALIIVGMIRAYHNTIFKLPVIGDVDLFQKMKGKE